jgi:hypothetical protein
VRSWVMGKDWQLTSLLLYRSLLDLAYLDVKPHDQGETRAHNRRSIIDLNPSSQILILNIAMSKDFTRHTRSHRDSGEAASMVSLEIIGGKDYRWRLGLSSGSQLVTTSELFQAPANFL